MICQLASNAVPLLSVETQTTAALPVDADTCDQTKSNSSSGPNNILSSAPGRRYRWNTSEVCLPSA